MGISNHMQYCINIQSMFCKSKTCETVDELTRYEFLPRQAAKPSGQGEYSCLLLEDGLCWMLEDGARRPHPTEICLAYYSRTRASAPRPPWLALYPPQKKNNAGCWRMGRGDPILLKFALHTIVGRGSPCPVLHEKCCLRCCKAT